MTTPRRVVAVLALVAVVVVTVAPTGGVSSMSAQRDVGVAVVDDERAYLNVTTYRPTVKESGEVRVLDVTNQLPREVTVSVESNRSDLSVGPSFNEEVEVGVGVSNSVPVRVNTCNDDTTKPVSLDLDVSGRSVAIDLTRTVRVEFDCVTQKTNEPSPTKEAVDESKGERAEHATGGTTTVATTPTTTSNDPTTTERGTRFTRRSTRATNDTTSS